MSFYTQYNKKKSNFALGLKFYIITKVYWSKVDSMEQISTSSNVEKAKDIENLQEFITKNSSCWRY
jgi:hypothetical protein